MSRHLHVGLRFEEIERHTVIRENKPLFLRVVEEMPTLILVVDLHELDNGLTTGPFWSLLVVEFLELGFGSDVEVLTILDDEVSDRGGFAVHVHLDECLA